MQTEESIVKSIIYGSPIQTSYGLFRSLCSAINHKDHIDKIIFYLRNNKNFQKYNKFVYAFRLEQPTNQTFITEQHMPQKQKFIQGYNDDTGLQGNGQKLLNLLKKFSVRNVLVIVAIRQKDPLKEFNAEHYVQVVKCAKDLLSSLYDKVVLSKESGQGYEKEEQIIYQPVQIKQFNIPLATFYSQARAPQNPNYVGKSFIRKKKDNKQKKLEVQMQYLNQKIEQLANSLEDSIQQFLNIQDSQIQFAIRYDKSNIVIKSFSLLAELFGLRYKQQLINEISKQKGPSKMANYLRSITMRALTTSSIRKLNQELLSNQNIKSQKIKNENLICYQVMRFIQILLKSYSFARKLALIESELEGESQSDQNSIKKNSQVEIQSQT